MDNRKWQAAAVASPPDVEAAPDEGYPTDGDPSSAVPATIPGAYWFHQVGEEIRQVITDAGLTPDDADLTQLSDAIQALIIAAGGITQVAADLRYLNIGYMLVRDEKAPGTVAGTSVTTAMPTAQTRVLNTTVANTISGASLSSNQITLPAGTYRINADAPSTANAHRAFLYNVTDGVVQLVGSNENCKTTADSDPIASRSNVRGRFTIADTKIFQLRHYTSEATTNTGLGTVMTNAGYNEVYSQVEIIKES